MNPLDAAKCECGEPGNKCHDCTGSGDGECRADAVRLVTVHFRDDCTAHHVNFGGGCLNCGGGTSIPMCAACADYHEKKGA